jgi:hypothetical protein
MAWYALGIDETIRVLEAMSAHIWVKEDKPEDAS